MAEEMIDLFDENNKPLGIKKPKSEVHSKGLWHRTVHIWIWNSKAEILLHLRSAHKQVYPDRWDLSSGGHVDAGEEPVASAVRELYEELGLSAGQDDLEFFKVREYNGIYNGVIDHEFYYIYFLKFDGSIRELAIQRGEVAQVKFFPLGELENELKLHPEMFVPHYDYWDIIINEVRRRTIIP